jgi:hypothetical protein
MLRIAADAPTQIDCCPLPSNVYGWRCTQSDSSFITGFVADAQLEAALQLTAQQRRPGSSATFEGLLPPPEELSVIAEHCNDRKRSAKSIQVKH